MIAALALFAVSALAGVADEAPKLGERIANVHFTDTRWLPRSLDDFGESSASVIVISQLGCPVAQRMLPEVADLETALRARGVHFVLIDVGSDDALVEVAARAVEAGIAFPVARDFDGAAARVLRPERTPEVFVLDRSRTLVYRGRIDSSQHVSGT